MLLSRRNLRTTMMTSDDVHLSRLFKRLPAGGIVRLGDGTILHKLANPAYTIVFKDSGALRKAANHPDAYHFAMLYVRGGIEIEGDIFSAVRIKENFKRTTIGPLGMLALSAQSLLPSRHSASRDARAISHHYDVSNSFYKLFLDSGLNYSCGYFRSPDEGIDAAEENKLQLIARKLRLREGESFLDIGCGWGGMIIHAAKNYGVTAHGITLSRLQFEYAQERIRTEGLTGRVTVELKDYRQLRGEQVYDKIASIGMYEHVGLRNWPVYFQTARRLLKDRGLFLNHGIVHCESPVPRPEGKFIAKMIFPGGELGTIGETVRAAEKNGFEVIDVESLREHYAKTLRHWATRLQQNAAEARKYVSEEIIRSRILFMAGYASEFEDGNISIYQTLLSRQGLRGLSGVPLTREYMNVDGPEGKETAVHAVPLH